MGRERETKKSENIYYSLLTAQHFRHLRLDRFRVYLHRRLSIQRTGDFQIAPRVSQKVETFGVAVRGGEHRRRGVCVFGREIYIRPVFQRHGDALQMSFLRGFHETRPAVSVLRLE